MSETSQQIVKSTPQELLDLMKKSRYLQERIDGGYLYTAGVDAKGDVLGKGVYMGLTACSEPCKCYGVNALSVACGFGYTVTLSKSGHVYAHGGLHIFGYKKVDKAKNIRSIACDGLNVYCIDDNGNVHWYGDLDEDDMEYIALNETVQTWTNIDRLYFSCDLPSVAVGVKKDGSVVACGNRQSGACDVGAWRDIFTVATGCGITVGLKKDGTLVSCGRDYAIKSQISQLSNITSIHITTFADMLSAVDGKNGIIYNFGISSGEAMEPIYNPDLLTLKVMPYAMAGFDKQGRIFKVNILNEEGINNQFSIQMAKIWQFDYDDDSLTEKELAKKKKLIAVEMVNRTFLQVEDWQLCTDLDTLVRERDEWEAMTPKERKKKYSSGGCYVATCVYGSYDCPEVWTLRRFRDDTLASTWYGRAFIKTYYAVSPHLVHMFGKTQWFKTFWRGRLDKLVAKLQSQGVESTAYQDK